MGGLRPTRLDELLGRGMKGIKSGTGRRPVRWRETMSHVPVHSVHICLQLYKTVLPCIDLSVIDGYQLRVLEAN